MKKYNFLTWWLDLSPKPLPYRIWKMIVTPAMFIAWVTFVAVYPDMYWNFCLCAVLPVGVVDTVWEVFNFRAYRKKMRRGGAGRRGRCVRRVTNGT